MLKKSIDRAECKVEIDYYLKGSVLRGTIESGATECRIHFVVETNEGQDDIEYVIRLAKQGCFAERLVETAVPIKSTYEVKGVAIVLETD